MQKFATEANINAIVTQAAAAALDDVDATDDFIPRNTNDRQEFFNQAMARAVKPIDSHANFVMMNPFHPAEEVIEHFRKNNILIGHRSPPLDTHIRISFGPPRGNARILAGMGCLAVPQTLHAALTRSGPEVRHRPRGRDKSPPIRIAPEVLKNYQR